MNQVRMAQENMFRTIQSDVMRLQVAQSRTTNAISTNKRVNAPSDSVYSETILRSRLSLSHVDQYRLNLEAANTWMTGSENSMQSIVDRLSRAKALAEQMATGTYSADQQAAAASEVTNLIDQIITLSNSMNNGYYIFAGTRSNQPAIVDALTMPDPAGVSDDSPAGHDTLAWAYSSGGNYYLRLGRQSAGAADTLAIAAANTLGETGALGLSFDAATFAHTQTGSDSPAQTDIYTSSQALAALTSLVSDRLGEELTFTGEGAAQTYRTNASVTFSAGGAAIGDSVTIGGDTYTFAAALAPAAASAWLAEQINATAGLNYYATVSGGEVTLRAKPGSAFDVTAAGANITVDQDTSLEQLMSQLDAGMKAVGVAHLDNGSLPAGAETVTLNGYAAWQWSDIINGVIPPAAATAANYASALATWIGSHTSDFTASVTSSGAGATVQIAAKEIGAAGNVTITASVPANLVTSGNLYGGLDGADTTGHIHASGSSTLRLATTVRGEVLSVDPTSGDVSVKLAWYDDGGKFQTATYAIPQGESAAVTIPELGGIKLYRDALNFKVGAVFELNLGHYQGNDEALDVNFSSLNHLRYNWTARQLLGDQMGVNLDGATAYATRQQTLPLSTGNVELSGVYRGLPPRDLTFDVIEAGQVPDDSVTLRAYWSDEDGQPHTKELTFSSAGLGGGLALPVYGDTPKIDLTGDAATAAVGNTGTGVINITGDYTGFYPRDISFTVDESGQLPGDGVRLVATWTDDEGHAHSETVSLTSAGADGAVELPDSNGVKIYLDSGTFVAGETYAYDLTLSPHHGGEAIYVNLDNGDFKVGDSFHYGIEKSPLHLLDTLKEWEYQLSNGNQEKAQTQSQRTLVALDKAMQTILDFVADSGARQDRVTVRQGIMDDQVTFHGQNLQDLQDVDMTQAFLDLRAQQTSYSVALKVISVMADLNLLNYM